MGLACIGGAHSGALALAGAREAVADAARFVAPAVVQLVECRLSPATEGDGDWCIPDSKASASASVCGGARV